VFTDLDATLLDAKTYSWEPASEALEALRNREASIVLVSSKTMAEMEPLHGELGLIDPFVVENGGGIIFAPQTTIADKIIAISKMPGPIPKGNALMLPLGIQYQQLVVALAEISKETQIPHRGFSAMSVEEVASLTGLEVREAERAKMRDFDEPFLIPENCGIQTPLIQRAAQQRGLTAVQGGRFWHLIGHEGKGRAVSLLIDAFRSLYGDVITIGLGDSPNDFPFLELVDIPVLVGGALRGLCLPDSLTRALHTSESGPKGWNGTMLAILSKGLA
jgi:mannosyl-3-phosphoglycerate phosphatase